MFWKGSRARARGCVKMAVGSVKLRARWKCGGIDKVVNMSVLLQWNQITHYVTNYMFEGVGVVGCQAHLPFHPATSHNRYSMRCCNFAVLGVVSCGRPISEFEIFDFEKQIDY